MPLGDGLTEKQANLPKSGTGIHEKWNFMHNMHHQGK
jgi:hypothetical protein